MIVDMKQLILDIGFGDIFDYGCCKYLEDSFPSMQWLWAERFLGMKNVSLHWPLKTVRIIVNAINGKDGWFFEPCEEFENAKAYMVNFVKEEMELYEQLNKISANIWKLKDLETRLIKRGEAEELLRSKRRKLA